MSDLRAAGPPLRERMDRLHDYGDDSGGPRAIAAYNLAVDHCLAIIDAHQCYDEAALAEALHMAHINCMQPGRVCVPSDPRYADFHPAMAAAIIARLHE